VTTRNVNSSCEVLWISRQSDEQVRAFFQGTPEVPVKPSTLPDVFSTIVGTGALWLANGNTTHVGVTGANYVDPWESNSDVIACNWSKDLTSPAGQFSIQVKPRLPYDILIKPGDVFIIFMDDDHRYGWDQRTHGTMVTVGIIDRVGKTTTAGSNGATIESVSITGRDFGAVLQETQTVFDKAFAVIDQTFFDSKFITQAAEANQSALSPSENILTLLDLIYRFSATNSKLVGGQWTLPSTTNEVTGQPVSLLSLLNVSAFVQTPIFGYSLAQSPGVTQAGNVWNLLDGFANRIVNEFFIDVRDFSQREFDVLKQLGTVAGETMSDDDIAKQLAKKQDVSSSGVFNQSTLEQDFSGTVDSAVNSPPMPVVALVLRQQPYDRDSFRLLPVNHLDYQEVFDYDEAFSTHDVVNFFKIAFPDLGPVAWELIFGIKVNLDSIPKFGIRRFEGETRYSFASSAAGDSFNEGDSTAIFGDVYHYYIELISTWYACNELLRSATITCRFRPEIRVGTRLRYLRVDDRILSYYVQGVNHTFGVSPGQSRTQLTCVRGYIEGQSDLPNNLIWTSEGSGIPPGWVNWGVSNPTDGMDASSDADERTVQNAQSTQ
jgi:hypothetical protein